jgi:hypothetical protein
MFPLLMILAGLPALADSLHLPAEMRQKVDATSSAIADGMRTAHQKVHKVGAESDLAQAVITDLGKIWAGVKNNSHRALVYLDHELHEHVLGQEEQLLRHR